MEPLIGLVHPTPTGPSAAGWTKNVFGGRVVQALIGVLFALTNADGRGLVRQTLFPM